MAAITFIVDQGACIGCGLCESICPEVFELREDRKSHIKNALKASKFKCTEEAAKSCPVAAITRVD